MKKKKKKKWKKVKKERRERKKSMRVQMRSINNRIGNHQQLKFEGKPPVEIHHSMKFNCAGHGFMAGHSGVQGKQGRRKKLPQSSNFCQVKKSPMGAHFG
jgi:hypothetical protein